MGETGHTEYVRKGRLEEVRCQVENYWQFRELTSKWVDLTIELCTLRKGISSDG